MGEAATAVAPSAPTQAPAPTAAPAPVTAAPPPTAAAPIPDYSGPGGGPPAAATEAYGYMADDVDQTMCEPAPPAPVASVPPPPAVRLDKAKEGETKEQRDARLNQAVAALTPEQLKEANAKAEALATKLQTEMGKTHIFGNNTEVTSCLQGLSPAEVQLVKEHYAKQHASAKKAGAELEGGGDLESDLFGKLDGKDKAVAEAVMSGDKVKSAAAFVEQAADNAGTDLDTWKAAMATLDTPEARKEFMAEMDKRTGKTNGAGYRELVEEETSSYDRDELEAMSVVDEDERAASMAATEISKSAYGGRYAQVMDGFYDTVIDRTPEQRAEMREAQRKYDPLMMFSNAGGGEDQMLDALERMENPKQRELLEGKMVALNNEALDETLEGELSDGHLDAGRAFAKGKYEEGLAKRMVANADNYIDDNETAMSSGFERVRLDDKTKAELAAIEDPTQRAAAEAKALGKQRESLRKQVDKVASEEGRGSYEQMKMEELTPTEILSANERERDGKVSDVNQLLLAGEGAIAGMGKDTSAFTRILSQKTPKEVEDFRTEFKKKTGQDLDTYVKEMATSDGEARDFDILLEGNYARMEPDQLAAMAEKDPKALIRRVKDLGEAAKGGAKENKYDPIGSAKKAIGNELGNELADMTSNAGERVDARMAAVDKLQSKLDKGGTLSEAENQELIEHMRYMAGDQKSYTENKTAVVRTVAEGAGTVANVTVMSLTGSKEAAAVAQTATECEIEGTLDPARMSTDRMVQKSVQLAGNLALGAAVPGITKNELAQNVIKGAAGGIVNTAADTQNLRDGGKFVTTAASNAMDGAMNGVASSAAEAGVGKFVGEQQHAVSAVAESAAETVATGDYSKSGWDLTQSTAREAAKGYAKKLGGQHYKDEQAAQAAARKREQEMDDADSPPDVIIDVEETPMVPQRILPVEEQLREPFTPAPADDPGVHVAPVQDVGGVETRPVVPVEDTPIRPDRVVDIEDPPPAPIPGLPIKAIEEAPRQPFAPAPSDDPGVHVAPIEDIGGVETRPVIPVEDTPLRPDRVVDIEDPPPAPIPGLPIKAIEEAPRQPFAPAPSDDTGVDVAPILDVDDDWLSIFGIGEDDVAAARAS